MSVNIANRSPGTFSTVQPRTPPQRLHERGRCRISRQTSVPKDRCRTAVASVDKATDGLIRTLSEGLASGRFPRLDKGQMIKREDAERAWGCTRKLANHGCALVLTLEQLKAPTRPQAISNAVLAELNRRGVLMRSAQSKATS